jgi:hypothetical protein
VFALVSMPMLHQIMMLMMMVTTTMTMMMMMAQLCVYASALVSIAISHLEYGFGLPSAIAMDVC